MITETNPTVFSPGSARASLNRIQFLLESLVDLDSSLRKLGSRLLVCLEASLSSVEVLFRLLKERGVEKLCFEYDTEPYYQAMDDRVKDHASALGIEVLSPVSHTLFNPVKIIEKNGGTPPLSYQSFLKIAGKPSPPLSTTISWLPPIENVEDVEILGIPTIKELGYGDIRQNEFSPFRGGESEALKRLREALNNEDGYQTLRNQRASHLYL